MSKQILIVDPDRILMEVLSANLAMAGYSPLQAATAADALELLEHSQPDLVISEVELSDVEAWKVIGQLRLQSTVPIIIISSKSNEIDKLHGFRLGADDYIIKPFSFAELLARVRAVLARCGADSLQQRIESNEILVDLERRFVLLRGEPVDLSLTEFRVLEVLVRHAPRPVSNEELVKEVWGISYLGEPDHVKHFIWRLRRKLGDGAGESRHIITVRGFGYRFGYYPDGKLPSLPLKQHRASDRKHG